MESRLPSGQALPRDTQTPELWPSRIHVCTHTDAHRQVCTQEGVCATAASGKGGHQSLSRLLDADASSQGPAGELSVGYT